MNCTAKDDLTRDTVPRMHRTAVPRPLPTARRVHRTGVDHSPRLFP